MKSLYLTVFIFGIILGYQGMKSRGVEVLVRGNVLSENSETSQAPTAKVTATPTFIPTPTLTLSPTPTMSLTPTLSATPKPTPVVIAPQDLEPLFKEFSSQYGIDSYKLKKIADCESHFNTGVYADPYAGMFQFTESTWTKYRNMMGKDPNINLRFGARESIETAAYVLSLNQENIWPACTKF